MKRNGPLEARVATLEEEVARLKSVREEEREASPTVVGAHCRNVCPRSSL